MGREFKDRIRAMNEMYTLPVNEFPTVLAGTVTKLSQFKITLEKEVNEVHDIIELRNSQVTLRYLDIEDVDILTAIADWLGDIIVYCHSEALKYGIPIEPVLQIIMDSNESKLDENGKPIFDENGKFLKGPNYWKPEPKIKALLQMAMNFRSNLDNHFFREAAEGKVAQQLDIQTFNCPTVGETK